MLTPEERALMTEGQDHLIELYVEQNEATRAAGPAAGTECGQPRRHNAGARAWVRSTAGCFSGKTNQLRATAI